jgi:hypothetical protein
MPDTEERKQARKELMELQAKGNEKTEEVLTRIKALEEKLTPKENNGETEDDSDWPF